jgi:hypothetical protein
MRVRPSKNMASRLVGMDSQYRRCSSCGKAREKHAGRAEGPRYQMRSHASHQALTEGYCYSVVKPGMTACRPYKIAEAAKCSTKMLPPVLSRWLAALIGWWRPAPCLVRPAMPSMILHTARIQEHRHAHPSLELVPVAAPPSYHDLCTAVRLQPQPTAADLQAKRQPHRGSIAEPALHPDFWLASKPRATIGYAYHCRLLHQSLSIDQSGTVALWST